MAKRTRAAVVESESDYDGLSEGSDASFAPQTTKKRGKQPRVVQNSKKRRVAQPAQSQDVREIALPCTLEGSIAVAHSISSHVITDPAPLGKALLAWYAGVHEVRGMPWRKPYDAALDRDQRAQRAYEVCIAI